MQNKKFKFITFCSASIPWMFCSIDYGSITAASGCKECYAVRSTVSFHKLLHNTSTSYVRTTSNGFKYFFYPPLFSSIIHDSIFKGNEYNEIWNFFIGQRWVINNKNDHFESILKAYWPISRMIIIFNVFKSSLIKYDYITQSIKKGRVNEIV